MNNTTKKASSFVFLLLRFFFIPVLFLKYRFKFDRETSKGIKPPCFILANHQTAFDQFAVGVGFRFAINFVASDSLFRYGLRSKLMMALARPIAFSKGSSDIIAIRNMMAVIKSGGSVAMFPSGNRSFFGDECTIVKGIGRLAKLLKAPLVLVQMRGGFNTKPRWGVKPGKGEMRARVERILQPEDLAAMSVAEIDEAIRQSICFNEFEYNETAQIKFRGRRRAEYLESALFWCPQCGSMKSLRSEGNEIFCRDCGAGAILDETGFFGKASLRGNMPGTILEWSRRQLDAVKAIDFSKWMDRPLFADEGITLFKAERARNETLLGRGSIAFFADRLVICGREFILAETTMAIQGIRKLTIYGKDGVFAAMAPFRTNFVKYMICGCRVRNQVLGIQEEYYGY